MGDPHATILVVDDDPAFREGLRWRLEREPGWEVRLASSWYDASDLLAATPVDVVVTDMQMERADSGYAVLRSAKSANPQTQVIIVTAYASVENAVHCVRAGCFDYLEKDLFDRGRQTFDVLVGSVQQALEFSRSGAERDSLEERLILADWRGMQGAEDAAAKGNALEGLCKSVFRTVPGWNRVDTRVRTRCEEIDLVILNESTEEFWRRFGTVILVECKNWSRRRPGVKEFAAFAAKIAERGSENCRLGFFVSLGGVARTFIDKAREAKKQGAVIVPLDRDQLWKLICAGDRGQFLRDLVAAQIMT